MRDKLSTIGGDVWSDFVGGGSSAADYTNDQSIPSPKNAQELGIDVSNGFKSSASYSQACTKMDAASEYQLDGTDCSSEARFICMKSCKKRYLVRRLHMLFDTIKLNSINHP